MLDILFGAILVVTAALASINVYQSYMNIALLRGGQTYLVRKLRRVEFALFLLELGTIALMSVLFAEVFLFDIPQSNEIVLIMVLIILFKAIVKAGVYRENLLFKRQLERLVELNIIEGKNINDKRR